MDIGDLFSSIDPNWIGIFVAVIAAVCAACYKVIPWVWKHTIFQYGNFDIHLIDHPPPNHIVHNFYFPYTLPMGESRLCCFVRANFGFQLARLNFRFLNFDGSNASRSDIELVGIEEGECDEKRLQAILSDTVGGLDGRYETMPVLGQNEALYFWLTFRSSAPWDGYLSFRAQDPSGFRCYGRHAVSVKATIEDSTMHTLGTKKNTALEVEYEEKVGAYYQENPIEHAGLGAGILQLVRIKIIGKRVEPINDVQVKVQRVVPEQRSLHGVPFHVQRMNDSTPPYQRSTVFAKGQEEYFDLVGYARFMLNTGQLHFRRIDGGRWEI